MAAALLMLCWIGLCAADDHREQAFIDLCGVIQRGEADEMVEVAGRVEQVTNLAPPFEGSRELFVRLQGKSGGGSVAVVYLCAHDAQVVVHERQQIRSQAVAYKTVRFTARDGRARSYPAFINVKLLEVPPAAGRSVSGDALWVTALLTAGMAAVFLVVAIWARRARTQRSAMNRQGCGSEVASELPPASEGDVDCRDLPEDPVAALEALRRRAAQ